MYREILMSHVLVLNPKKPPSLLDAVDLWDYTLEGDNSKPTTDDDKNLYNTDCLETQTDFDKGLIESLNFMSIASNEQIQEKIEKNQQLHARKD